MHDGLWDAFWDVILNSGSFKRSPDAARSWLAGLILMLVLAAVFGLVLLWRRF